jgi:hypothetical protein
LIASDGVNRYQNKNLLKEKNNIILDLKSITSFLQIQNQILVVKSNKDFLRVINKYKYSHEKNNKKVINSWLENRKRKSKNKIRNFLLNPQSGHYKLFITFYTYFFSYDFRKNYLAPFLRKILKGYYLQLQIQQNQFRKEVASHKDLNLFFKKNNFFPYLKTNHNKINSNYISMQFRFRKLDAKTFGKDSLERDASLIIWCLVINLFDYFFPNVKIFLLGRAEEKPFFIKNYKNTHIRNKKDHLYDDMKKMLQSSCFLGSSSGFAAIANFSELPYLITKVNKDARKNYVISSSSNKLPFARPNQVLTDKEDPLEIMSFYCKIKKQDFSVIKNYFKNKSKLFAKLKDKESFILDNLVIQNNNFFINEYLANSKIKDENLFYLYLISTLNQ